MVTAAPQKAWMLTCMKTCTDKVIFPDYTTFLTFIIHAYPYIGKSQQEDMIRKFNCSTHVVSFLPNFATVLYFTVHWVTIVNLVKLSPDFGRLSKSCLGILRLHTD